MGRWGCVTRTALRPILVLVAWDKSDASVSDVTFSHHLDKPGRRLEATRTVRGMRAEAPSN